MHIKKSLKDISNNHPVLSLDEKNILSLARIETIDQLLDIAAGGKRNKIDDDKILNTDSIIASRYILRKIKQILYIKPKNIKNNKVANTAKQIGDTMLEKGGIECFAVGTYIQKIALKIEKIYLRFERYSHYIANKELEEANSTDNLTELLNRKTMDLFIQDAIEEKKRNGTNYRLVLIDIDHFKNINDIYGHLTGDNVLIELANIFKEKFRGNDKVARWGGEEFTILMKGGEEESYLDKIEKLRLFIEETLVKNVTNSTLKIEGNITISAGITCIKETDKQFNEVIQRADTRLYKAKNTRNTVVFKAGVEENKAIKKEAE